MPKCAVCGSQGDADHITTLGTGGGIDWPLCPTHFYAFDLATTHASDGGLGGDGSQPWEAVPVACPEASPWGDENPASADDVAQWERSVLEAIVASRTADADLAAVATSYLTEALSIKA